MRRVEAVGLGRAGVTRHPQRLKSFLLEGVRAMAQAACGVQAKGLDIGGAGGCVSVAACGSGMGRGLGLSVLCLLLSGLVGLVCASSQVRAEARPESPALYALIPAEAGIATEAGAHEAQARAFLSGVAPGAEPLQSFVPGDPAETIPRAALSPFVEVERLLYEARELSARFDEVSAMERLLWAERLLLEQLELPHVHAFLAEVDLALGLVAARLSLTGLAETKLSRALSLDPARRLRAGEAPPQLEAFARALEKQREQTPVSQVSVEVEPSQAAIWLDARRVGTSLETRKGSHVLQVTAPGYRPYAALVDFSAGRRPALRVSLSPTPVEQARLALQTALEAADAVRARQKGAEFARHSARTLWLFEVGKGGSERMLVYRCQPVCELSTGLEGPEPVALASLTGRAATPENWLQATEHARADVLDAGAARPSDRRRVRRRRLGWVSAALLVGAGVTLGALLAREPEVRRERSLTLDPGDLPPAP